MGSSCNSCCNKKKQNFPLGSTKDNVVTIGKIKEPKGFFTNKRNENQIEDENSSGAWVKMTTMKNVARAKPEPEEEIKKEENSFDCEDAKRNLLKIREDSGGLIESTSRNTLSPKEEQDTVNLLENTQPVVGKQQLLKRTITPSFTNIDPRKKNKTKISQNIKEIEAIPKEDDGNMSFKEEERENKIEAETQENAEIKPQKLLTFPKFPAKQNEENKLYKKESYTLHPKKEELCDVFPMEVNHLKKPIKKENSLVVPKEIQTPPPKNLPMKNQDSKPTIESESKKRIVVVENNKDKKQSIFKNILKKAPKNAAENPEISTKNQNLIIEKAVVPEKPESKNVKPLEIKFQETQIIEQHRIKISKLNIFSSFTQVNH